MKQKLICIVCPMGCHLDVDIDNDYAVTGNECKRGIAYAKKELTNPTRTITSTIKIRGGIYNRLPVKTDKEISKKQVFEAMKLLDDVIVESPIKVGTIILSNILDTDVNIVASRSM
jgi:CxxC motif-containing protein